MKEKTYYDMLHLPRTATPDEIKHAYRMLRQKNDPDKNAPTDRQLFEAVVKELSEAYETLRNPQKRAAYDRTLADAARQKDAAQSGDAPTSPTQSDPRSSQSQSQPNQSAAATPNGYRKRGSTQRSYRSRFSRPTSTAPTTWYEGFKARCRHVIHQGNQFGIQLLTGATVTGVVLYGLAPLANRQLADTLSNPTFFTGTVVGLLLTFFITLALIRFSVYLVGIIRFPQLPYLCAIVCFLVFVNYHTISISDFSSAVEKLQPDAATQSAATSGTADEVMFTDNLRAMQEQLSTAEVTELQRLLAQDSSIYPEGYVTGHYGPLTHHALIRFQEHNGLPAEGYYGDRTRAKLAAVFDYDFSSSIATSPNSSPGGSPSVETGALPETLTLQLFNQYNIPIPAPAGTTLRKLRVYDELGEAVPGAFSPVENAYGTIAFSKQLPAGTYTIKWPAWSTYSDRALSSTGRRSTRFLSEGSHELQYDPVQSMYLQLPLTQTAQRISTGFVLTQIVNEAGTPLRIRSSNLSVTGPRGARVGSFSSATRENELWYALRWESSGSAPGEHTLTISHPAYEEKSVSFTIPNLMKETDAAIVDRSSIVLDTIVLEQP